MEFSSGLGGEINFHYAFPSRHHKEFSNRNEFNVVVAGCACFVRHNDFLYALRISIARRFEFIVLGRDANQAVNL